MEERELILASPLFAGLTAAEAAAALPCLGARRVRFARGEYLLRAGGRTAELGLVLSGALLVIQEDFWGGRNILAKLGPGQLFAESFACAPDRPLNVSVTAETPGEALFLDAGHILRPCARQCPFHALLIRNLAGVLAEKNLRLNEKLTHTGRRTTRAKLLSYLSAEAEKRGRADFEIPFSRQELADYLAVDRSAMSAELSRLRDEGVLRFDRSRFELLREVGETL